jgi:hypothetical protein
MTPFRPIVDATLRRRRTKPALTNQSPRSASAAAAHDLPTAACKPGSGAVRDVRRENQSKPDAPITVVVRDLIALCHGAVISPIVKAPAAKNSLISWTFVRRSILGNAVNVAREHILAPFPPHYRISHICRVDSVPSAPPAGCNHRSCGRTMPLRRYRHCR